MKIYSNRNEKAEYHCVILNADMKEKNLGNGKHIEYPMMPTGLIDHSDILPQTYFGEYEFLIVVTMYNEDNDLFHRTMNSINKNLYSFYENDVHSDKIAVVVIIDGLEQFIGKIEKDKSTDYYKSLFDIDEIYKYFGIQKDDKASLLKVHESIKKKVNVSGMMESLKNSRLRSSIDDTTKDLLKEHQREIAHCFVSSVKFEESHEHSLKVFFCVKHENKRKLNSHLWFFEGFCKVNNPRFCMLIDAGTEPEDEALYLLYKAMRKDPQIAGVCGEIIPRAINEESFFDVFFFAQKVEYKFSHILDKSFESSLGYISVLPGAFSAYRWEALQAYDEKGPLWGDYFKSINKPWLMDCYQSNIYLAEDRVLCLSLVASKGKSYILKFVRGSRAFTDPPSTFEQLLLQRRRWINGSWFALLDSVKNSKKILNSGHTCCRKSIFICQMLYYVLNIMYSFVMVGIFYLALSICLREQFSSGAVETNSEFVGTLLNAIYIALLVVTFILSLGSDVKKASKTFWAISALFSMYMVLLLVLLVVIFLSNWKSPIIYIPVAITFAGFFLITLLNKATSGVAYGCIQFLIATPTYVNTFTIYAICNIHDCSWGNRPEVMSSEELAKLEDYEQYRTGWALLWAFINGFLGYYLSAVNASSTSYRNYIYLVGIIGMGLLYIRFLGGFLFFFKQKCCKYTCISSEKSPDDSKIELGIQ